MPRYLLIASESPLERRTRDFFALGTSLARAAEVTVFLVQNGVLGARAGGGADWLGGLRDAGVALLADDFSLRERGIKPSGLAAGVRAASLDVVIDALLAGSKVLWS